MKKKKLFILTLVLSLLLGMETFAVENPTLWWEQEGSTLTDHGIEGISIVEKEYTFSQEETMTPSNASSKRVLTPKLGPCSDTSRFSDSMRGSAALGLGYKSGKTITKADRYSMDIYFVDQDGKEAGGYGNVEVTLNIPDVTPDTEVSVRYYYSDSVQGQMAKAGNGTATITMPCGRESVYIAVDRTPVSNSGSDSNTGSKTENAGNTGGNGGGSGSSGRPEAYSRGETVGDIRVEKKGRSARVIKAKGEEATVIVHPFITAGTKTFTQEQAQKILGTKSACGIYSFDISLVNAGEDYSSVILKEGSVEVTFYVPGVTSESNVVLRHWINGSKNYEDLPVTLGNGTVTAAFTSFSPVVILVAQDGTPTGASVTAGSTSPKTAETSMIYVAEALALLSAVGFVLCHKRACKLTLSSSGRG